MAVPEASAFKGLSDEANGSCAGRHAINPLVWGSASHVLGEGVVTPLQKRKEAACPSHGPVGRDLAWARAVRGMSLWVHLPARLPYPPREDVQEGISHSRLAAAAPSKGR